MIVHPAAYAILLLSLPRFHPVYGQPLTETKGQPTSDIERKIDRKRQLKKVKKGGGIPIVVDSNVDILEHPCSSRSDKDECGTEEEECVWIDGQCVNSPPKCSSFSKQKSCEKNKFTVDCSWDKGACFDPNQKETSMSTLWPTYSPTMSEPPHIATPSLTTHSIITDAIPNCDPIGSRPSLPSLMIPTRNNPVILSPSISPTTSPLPKIETDLPKVDKPDEVTFRRGDLRKDIARFGIKVSKGLIVREIAKANIKVNLATGKKSKLRFHSSPDGAAVISLPTGYVYVSNSEVESGKGGVYGVYFDHDGNVLDYKMLLSGTTRNCSGGTTPWGTFVSCEEYGKGQCWQVDPLGEHQSSITQLGGDGGNFEAVACDDRNPSQPLFFVTEDHAFGTLRKYTPPPELPGTAAGWDALHVEGGNTQYLVFLDDERFTWSCDELIGRHSQEKYFPNVEGISFQNGEQGGLLYFVSKVTYKLYVLNLDNGTYETSSTREYSLYNGEFQHSPDQLVRTDGNFIYFTEDGGKTAGVYAIDAEGQSYAIIEAYDEKYFNDETTGLAFSPDGTRMYVCFQDCGCDNTGESDCGCLFEFWRDDGRTFDGDTMSLKFHSSEK